MRVFNSADNLLEYSTRFIFLQPLLLLNQVEQLSPRRILQHNKDISRFVNKFEVLYDVWVVEPSEHFYFAFDLFEDTLLSDSSFVKYLDGYFVPGDLVCPHYEKHLETKHSHLHFTLPKVPTPRFFDSL